MCGIRIWPTPNCSKAKHLMPWKKPQGFWLPHIRKQLKMVSFSDIIALMAYQLGVGYATNLGCCEAPESGHDGGSYQNPSINGVFSMVLAFGRTDVKSPTSPLRRIWPACSDLFSGSSGWVGNFLSVLPVPCVHIAKCCDSWTGKGLRMAVQRLFQDRAVIRQRWLLEDRVRSLT